MAKEHDEYIKKTRETIRRVAGDLRFPDDGGKIYTLADAIGLLQETTDPDEHYDLCIDLVHSGQITSEQLTALIKGLK